jgi:flagellar basal body-associated protein FliL
MIAELQINISEQKKKRNFLKGNIYAWHKTIGLMTVVPVIFWTLSGLMHPFMAHWFKPEIPRQFVVPKVLDKAQIALSVQEVLEKNNIEQFKNFRLVSYEGKTYYQVKVEDTQIRYFDAQTAQELKNGEQLYAEYLARYFLDDQKSALKNIRLQTDFDGEYKFVNRLLPVWRIDFDRPDQMTIYVETTSDRLGTFNPLSRKAFLWIFNNFHNWSFLENISNNWVRITVMLILLSIISLSALSGLVIYGFFWKRFKTQPKANTKQGVLRRYHRQIALGTAFLTLTFALSGAYHATRKYSPNLLPKMEHSPTFKTTELSKSSLELDLDWNRLHNLSVVKINETPYFQAFYKAQGEKPAKIEYLKALNGEVLEDGNQKYAQYLTEFFIAKIENPIEQITGCCEMSSALKTSQIVQANLLETKEITAFDNREYGFIFKRLPVVKFQYDSPGKDAFYVETSSSRLAAHISNADRAEGISFAIFHKFFLMEWAGKNVRDGIMMLSAFGVLTVSILGLLIYLKK